MTRSSARVARELVATACRAPSLHNTQPWSWRIREGHATLELYADRERQLPATDPSGRDLAISCGSAVHHLLAAAPALGVRAEATLLPDETEPDLFAIIRLSRGENPTPDAAGLLTALENRVTDRRGFPAWEVPDTRVSRLRQAAGGWGAHVLPIVDPMLVMLTEDLIERARATQADDPDIAAELATWTAREGVDGVPAHVAIPRPRSGLDPAPSRFTRGERHRRPPAAERLLAICTGGDDTLSWLQSGQTLSAFWLRATLDGLALTPISQVVEVDTTRRRLRRELLSDLAWPQILLRMGWREHTGTPTPHTGRRSLDDVLLP